MGKQDGAKMPGIYYVNWFRKDQEGGFIWPGFGENSRVLEWIFNRCEGTAEAVETPIGRLPTLDGLNFSGLDLSQDDIATLLKVDVEGWLSEIPMIEEYYSSFGDHVPSELWQELQLLKEQLKTAKAGAA